jgi:hypothetical protein
MKKRTRRVIERLRGALIDAMMVIVKEHACDGCDTSVGHHEPTCKYTRAMAHADDVLEGNKR